VEPKVLFSGLPTCATYLWLIWATACLYALCAHIQVHTSLSGPIALGGVGNPRLKLGHPLYTVLTAVLDNIVCSMGQRECFLVTEAAFWTSAGLTLGSKAGIERHDMDVCN
jgi:hypothetical protein